MPRRPWTSQSKFLSFFLSFFLSLFIYLFIYFIISPFSFFFLSFFLSFFLAFETFGLSVVFFPTNRVCLLRILNLKKVSFFFFFFKYLGSTNHLAPNIFTAILLIEL